MKISKKYIKQCIIAFIILFGMYYLTNRICHPKKNMVNVKRNTTYRELVWNYGMPDVVTGNYFIFGIRSTNPDKFVVYKVDDNTSYQLWFYKQKFEYRLCFFNVVEDGVIRRKELKEK